MREREKLRERERGREGERARGREGGRGEGVCILIRIDRYIHHRMVTSNTKEHTNILRQLPSAPSTYDGGLSALYVTSKLHQSPTPDPRVSSWKGARGHSSLDATAGYEHP